MVGMKETKKYTLDDLFNMIKSSDYLNRTVILGLFKYDDDEDSKEERLRRSIEYNILIAKLHLDTLNRIVDESK